MTNKIGKVRAIALSNEYKNYIKEFFDGIDQEEANLYVAKIVGDSSQTLMEGETLHQFLDFLFISEGYGTAAFIAEFFPEKGLELVEHFFLEEFIDFAHVESFLNFMNSIVHISKMEIENDMEYGYTKFLK